MNSERPPRRASYLVLISLVLAAGIVFRFTNLGRKVYWHDEAITSLWMSGYRIGEATRLLTTDTPIKVRELQRFQHLSPDRGVFRTIFALAVNDPKHPPIYFGALRLWMSLVGDSVAAVRSLSAVLSLLVFPLAYWLCLELFGSRPAAWFTVGLIAVSPFHVLYAQEAKQYSLWTVAILLANLTLLRALRLQTRSAWRMYAFAVAFSLYTHTLSVFVLLAHALYVGFGTARRPEMSRIRFPKGMGEYLRATAWGIASFLPWFVIIVARFRILRGNTSWVTRNESVRVLAQHWLSGLCSVFASVPEPAMVVCFAAVALMIWSYLHVRRSAGQQAWWFILFLTIIPALALIVPDLVLGGVRSTPARYFVPCYLSVQLSVAYLLTSGLASANATRRAISLSAGAVLLLVGAFSCWSDSSKELTWNKVDLTYEPGIGRIVNRTANPLLLSQSNASLIGYLLALSHSVDPEANVQLLGNAITPIAFDQYTEVFVYLPSQLMRHVLENEMSCHMEPVHEARQLWRLRQRTEPY